MLEAIWVFLGLIVVSGVMYALATYVFGRGEDLAPMPPDATPMVLPEARSLNGSDIRRVRLPVSVRGYRMSDVDLLLDRVADELDQSADRRTVAANEPEQSVPPSVVGSEPADVTQHDDRESAAEEPMTPPDLPPNDEMVNDWVPKRWEAPDPADREPDDWEPKRWEAPAPADDGPDDEWAPRSDQGLDRVSPPTVRPPQSDGQTESGS